MATVNAHPASQRGVDGDAAPWSLRFLRLGFGVSRRVSRRATVALLTRLFVTPRRHGTPAREHEVLARGRRETIAIGGRALALWRYPAAAPVASTAPLALLVHGWEGRGSQLGAFVAPLTARGFEVALFDHVGHGASEGRRSSLIAMADAVEAVARHVGAARIAGVVAHSMGSAAVTLAADRGAFGSPPERDRLPRFVYVAPPYDLVRYFGHYLELVVGDQDLLPDMLQRMERRFGARVEDVHYDILLPRRSEPLVVLHSTDDLDVPVEAGRLVADGWPGARFEALTSLGHRRILRDPAVAARAAAFVACEGAHPEIHPCP